MWYLVGKYISVTLGALASIKLPRLFGAPIVSLVATLLKIDVSEAEHALSHYRSTQDLFTRRLRAGARPFEAGLVSPVDGFFRAAGPTSQFIHSSVKGQKYDLQEFLGQTELAKKLETGSFVNLYLSPRDYHRIHAPCTLSIKRRIHIPGCLWPVNSWALTRVPLLFQKNERVVLEFESEFGCGALVMVGALNVGSMQLAFEEIRTNHPLSWTRSRQSRNFEPAVAVEKGQELGTFLLGSSVLLFFAGQMKFVAREKGLAIRLGQSLG